MIDHTPRGSVYANHPEFDAMQCRPIRTTERVGMTRDGWKVRQVITVYDFGKPDRSIADPDATLNAPEPTAGEATEARRRYATVDGDAVRAYLREHGLTTAPAISRAHNYNEKYLRAHMGEGDGTAYQKFDTYPQLWGLADVTYPRRDTLPPYAQKFYDAIREHGPLTATALCDLTGITIGGATNRLGQWRDVFEQVGYETTYSGHGRQHQVALWGLVNA